LYPQALLGVGRLLSLAFAQRLALKRLAAGLLVSERSTFLRLQLAKEASNPSRPSSHF
jgi:hypothetical protein